VTFKDLQKLVQSQSGPEHNQLLQRLRQTILDMGPEKNRLEDTHNQGRLLFRSYYWASKKKTIKGNQSSDLNHGNERKNYVPDSTCIFSFKKYKEYRHNIRG
jgi:hypothetical protein